MLLEIADFRIHPGQQAEFGAAIAHGVAIVLPTSPGCISARVPRGIESPAARQTMPWPPMTPSVLLAAVEKRVSMAFWRGGLRARVRVMLTQRLTLSVR